MKNFTNNFKQFTSRLSARWLIMALMMLVGTSSAWAYSQSASKTLYFNASSSGLTMNSTYKLIYMIGHGSWTSAYPLKPVQYTKNMYTLSTVKWDNCTEVAFFQVKQSESWGDEGNSITHRKAYAQKSTNIHSLASSISANVYFYGNLSRGSSTDYTNATNSYNITLTNKCDGVDNNEAGTIAVSRWNSTNSAYGTAYSAWLSNSNSSTKYLSALKVTATPKSGYELVSLTVNGTSVSSGHEFEVTAATTIVATWKKSYTYPAVSTISATVDGDNLVCEGKITSMGSATTVVWAFTVLSNDNISKATTDWKYPDGQNKITAANTPFTYNIPISSLSLTEGITYYVRAMAVDLDNPGISNNQYGNGVAGDAISFVYEQEAGVKIAALGSKALYTNDPTHFIPLYVSNEDLAGVGATSVKKYTWQFSDNGTSGWEDCTRNYGNFNAKNNKSNSKVVVSNGSDKSNNYRANKVGYYRCKLTYDNGEEQVSGNIQVTATTNIKTNKQHIGITYNLPIISVNTGAKSFPSDQGLATKSSDCGSSRYPSIHADDMKKKISVDVMMFNPDGTICYDRKARMNYRGSSSLNFKKKSYAFVTGKEKTKNLDGDVDTGKANLFGLSNGAEDKDWVLYAATPDPSMMRNRLVFDLYQNMRNLGVGQDETKEWGVNSMYVELVVNGEYRGVYVLMDKITCNANRVNIKNENGFIVKFDKTDVVDRVENTDGDQKTFATSRTGTKNSSNGIESYGSCIDQRFEIEYPEKEDIELWDAFYGKVQQRFEDFETALANKDYATVRKLIDYNSWADWFIITELAKNQDGFRASCIFVYDGDKIEARPLWDQELSFNNGTRVKHGIDSPEGLLITTPSVYSDAFYPPFWFTGNKGTSVTGGLLNDPCFVSLVKQKWATYQSGICSAVSIGDMVAAYNTELGGAISREAARWPYTEAVRGKTTDGDYVGYYSQGEGNPNQYSYDASKNAITAWIADRSTALTASDGLGKAINNLKGEALIFTITPSLAETTPWQQVQLTVNAPAGYEYTLNVDELKDDNAIIKENGDSYGIKIPRPAAWGVGGNGTEQSKQYNVTATIEVSGENDCGTISNNTATSVVKLNDITEACNPEIIKK